MRKCPTSCDCRQGSFLDPCQLLLHLAADISGFFLQDNTDIVADKLTTFILQALAAIRNPGENFGKFFQLFSLQQLCGNPSGQCGHQGVHSMNH
ncbi:hypothetical protein DMENIID0001_030020 [Sergentomyia squamirostris]